MFVWGFAAVVILFCVAAHKYITAKRKREWEEYLREIDNKPTARPTGQLPYAYKRYAPATALVKEEPKSVVEEDDGPNMLDAILGVNALMASNERVISESQGDLFTQDAFSGGESGGGGGGDNWDDDGGGSSNNDASGYSFESGDSASADSSSDSDVSGLD